LAAPTLDAALTEVPKLFAVIVLTFPAGHAISPLDLREETCDHQSRSEARVTPRFGLAPPEVDASDGVHYGGLISCLPFRIGPWILCSFAPTNHGPFADLPAKSFPLYCAHQQHSV